MFKNQRYATCGVNARIPLITQIMMWGMIDSLQAVEKDYLQIFRLSEENGKQKIVHEQEQPEYKKEYILGEIEPVNEKVYVIDSEEYSTMLLAEEY